MWLFIEPVDVWLFRDGRPFDAGADHAARSIFPPWPGTLQGALRSKVLALFDVDLAAYQNGVAPAPVRKQIGVPNQPGDLRISGPFVARRAGDQLIPYFPCPMDLIKRADWGLLKPQAMASLANWPVPALRPLGTEAEADLAGKGDGVTYWLDGAGLTQYLAGQTPDPKHFVAEGCLWLREGRFGVGIDSAVQRPEEGLLYQAEYLRLSDGVGLLAEVIGLDETPWAQAGLLSLGGEMRAARYSVVSRPTSWPASALGETRASGLKIYLATPVYFRDGWQSRAWAVDASELKLVAAAVPRAVSAGGWDMARNRPKPTRRYVPAGSVYYFENPAQAWEPPVSLGDDASEDQMGFGCYFTGRW